MNIRNMYTYIVLRCKIIHTIIIEEVSSKTGSGADEVEVIKIKKNVCYF